MLRAEIQPAKPTEYITVALCALALVRPHCGKTCTAGKIVLRGRLLHPLHGTRHVNCPAAVAARAMVLYPPRMRTCAFAHVRHVHMPVQSHNWASGILQASSYLCSSLNRCGLAVQLRRLPAARPDPQVAWTCKQVEGLKPALPAQRLEGLISPTLLDAGPSERSGSDLVPTAVLALPRRVPPTRLSFDTLKRRWSSLHGFFSAHGSAWTPTRRLRGVCDLHDWAIALRCKRGFLSSVSPWPEAD